LIGVLKETFCNDARRKKRKRWRKALDLKGLGLLGRAKGKKY